MDQLKADLWSEAQYGMPAMHGYDVLIMTRCRWTSCVVHPLPKKASLKLALGSTTTARSRSCQLRTTPLQPFDDVSSFWTLAWIPEFQVESSLLNWQFITLSPTTGDECSCSENRCVQQWCLQGGLRDHVLREHRQGHMQRVRSLTAEFVFFIHPGSTMVIHGDPWSCHSWRI